MRALADLIDTEDSAWPEVLNAVAGAPCPVTVLPADQGRADAELERLQVTTRSWLGAVVHRTGGLVIDHGWLRVFGSGSAGDRLASLGEMNPTDGPLLVGVDVLGGRFAWGADGGTPSIRYFAPDSLRWEDLEIGYGHWLAAMLGGATAQFYADLRWDGWAEEVAACGLDQAISLFPPPWTVEGKDRNAVSRRPVPMAEALSLQDL
ncbi:DUF2625 family protein [Actinoplanes flavus]|uniref:DUF2625 family protein n=1 Tax=Actinoplanes flavus TaxID=2820290 RepID=A0ABS3UZH6_9ACTN|nr:DUF2625 family protein [Actinoplanes flavus]MBO3743985.1 DUF2625 family protein [Actinoplanes flavus]